MTPRVLVLFYSQTGQTEAAAEALVKPLEESGWTVDWRRLETEERYPFPWGLRGFIDAFPETVAWRPPRLRPLEIDRDQPPDLIVLASQVWYLAPSLPTQAFLESSDRSVLSGRPVVAVVTCRNMWYAAVIRLEERLRRAGAALLGTVVLTDKSPRWATFVMTPRLFLTGKRNALWGIVPAPGIASAELVRATRIGESLATRLAPLERQGGPAPAVEVVPENLVLDKFAAGVFPYFAGPILFLGRVGGRRARAAGLGGFATCLVLGVIASLPALAFARILFGGRMRAAAENYGRRLEARAEDAEAAAPLGGVTS
jgi:hypothetical protein